MGTGWRNIPHCSVSACPSWHTYCTRQYPIDKVESFLDYKKIYQKVLVQVVTFVACVDGGMIEIPM